MNRARVITRFRSRSGVDQLNSPFTLGVERSKKLLDMERITFGIRAFQLVIVTGTVPNRRGSIVNRRPIRYGFRGTLTIHHVWCEHGLKHTEMIDFVHT